MITMTMDERQLAAARISDLLDLLRRHQGPETAAIIEECEALARAIAAFHLEGIRFRIFNVDRLIGRHDASVPDGAAVLLQQARQHLEAAGFHTRSHQAPG
jgi:hypothetical protein